MLFKTLTSIKNAYLQSSYPSNRLLFLIIKCLVICKSLLLDSEYDGSHRLPLHQIRVRWLRNPQCARWFLVLTILGKKVIPEKKSCAA
jgi:hypothetical protein